MLNFLVYKGSFCSLIVKALEHNLKESEFKLQLHTITFTLDSYSWKSYEPPYFPATG